MAAVIAVGKSYVYDIWFLIMKSASRNFMVLEILWCQCLGSGSYLLVPCIAEWLDQALNWFIDLLGRFIIANAQGVQLFVHSMQDVFQCFCRQIKRFLMNDFMLPAIVTCTMKQPCTNSWDCWVPIPAPLCMQWLTWVSVFLPVCLDSSLYGTPLRGR